MSAITTINPATGEKLAEYPGLDEAGLDAALQQYLLDHSLALQALNDNLHHDVRIDLSLLPVGDGLTLARKR